MNPQPDPAPPAAGPGPSPGACAAHGTLADALQAAVRRGLQRLDAQLLLLHALGRAPHDRAWLAAHDRDALPVLVQQQFLLLCERRLQAEPVAYLTGFKAFYGLDLAVDPRVLVPRPDTETLVDWALAVLPAWPVQGAGDATTAAPRVLDLGTGSGAIALALKHMRPHVCVCGVDASRAALAVAVSNAQRLQLDVDFSLGDWLHSVQGRFDAIVSNPPYIAEHDPHLPALRHEPVSALTSGADGLRDLRRIVSAAPDHLLPGGWLLLEHGHDQASPVQALLRERGFAQVQSRNDLNGIARCSGGVWLCASPMTGDGQLAR